MTWLRKSAATVGAKVRMHPSGNQHRYNGTIIEVSADQERITIESESGGPPKTATWSMYYRRFEGVYGFVHAGHKL